MVLLLGSSSYSLSGCAASLCTGIIIAKRTAKANRNSWQEFPNVLTRYKQILRSLLGSDEGGNSHKTRGLSWGLQFCYGKAWFSTLGMWWGSQVRFSMCLWTPWSIRNNTKYSLTVLFLSHGVPLVPAWRLLLGGHWLVGTERGRSPLQPGGRLCISALACFQQNNTTMFIFKSTHCLTK